MANDERPLNERLSGLSPAQLKALLRKGNENTGARPAKPGHMPRNPGGVYPLSKAQERMWFLNMLAGGEAVYNNPAALRVKGPSPINISTLTTSLEMLITRHEILRTTFRTENGVPVQVIHPQGKACIQYTDLRRMAPADREKKAMEEALAHGNSFIPLDSLPLVRFTVLHLQDLEYLLLINPHHIISDGWSNALFAKELSMTYASLESGEKPPFPAPEYQYVDFVKWEQDWMSSAASNSQMEFWRTRLEHLPEPLKLPLDFPRPPVMSYRGSREFSLVEAREADRFRNFCRNNDLTLFHLLFGTFSLLMAKYSGQYDLIIGMPVARRNQLWFQNTMGLFINTLPVRLQIDQSLNVAGFLHYIKSCSREALLRQELPFEKLIEEVNPDRNLGSNPVFQVHFVHQNIPSLYSVKGMEVKPESIDYSHSKFDLNFWVEEANRELILSATYPADIFLPSTVSRIITNYRLLLQSITSNPDTTCQKLQVFLEEQLSVFEGPGRDFRIGGECSWLTAFRSCVMKFPGYIAVRDVSASLTYSGLDEESDRLAAKLREAGVSEGDLVGLHMPRDHSMIAAIIAVFKCGAAYVPMDPGFPDERIEFMARDAGLTGIIGKEGFIPRNGAERIRSENDSGSGDPAYLIYTSGTTGAPKGVRVGQAQLLNYSLAVWERMKLEPGDSCATVSSIAFDLGNTSIFPPLLQGAEVVVVPEEYSTDASLLAGWFAVAPVDCLKIVPSHLMSLLSSGKADLILPKKLLITGGEKCTASIAARVRSLSPDLRMINHYGPTEATVGALTWELPLESPLKPPPDGDTFPIGFALSNTRVYIADPQMNLLPKGAGGEILLGGRQIAAGYHDRPDMTFEKFPEDPRHPGERLYRTGDLGKMCPDGSVIFLGRKDDQVKVRGYRVEIREVEQIMEQHAAVARAVAVLTEANDGVSSLNAVIILSDGASYPGPEYRNWLSQRLPSYMIPSLIRVAESLPLTNNGKVDMKRLRILFGENSVSGSGAVAPRDITELRLLRLFEEVLGKSSFGITDSFFDLGGHSLLAIRLFSGIEREFGIHMPLAALFTHSSVKALAEAVRSEGILVKETSLVSIRAGTGVKKLYLVHPAGGNVLCYFELAKELPAEITVYGLQASGLSGKTLNSVSDMARFYLGEIEQSENPADMIFGGWSMGALVAFEMARQVKHVLGNSPGLLIIDQAAPSAIENKVIKQQPDPVNRLLAFAGKVAILVGKPLGISESDLRDKEPVAQSEIFMEVFIRVGLVPGDMKVNQFHGYLETMIRHNEITSECRAGIHDGPALLVRASETPEMPGLAGDSVGRAPDLGWGNYIPGKLVIRDIPGNHVSVMTQPLVKGVASSLEKWLAPEYEPPQEKEER